MLVYLFNLGRFWYLPGTFKGGKLKQKKTLCVTLSKQRIKVIQWALLIGSMKVSWNIGVAFCLLLILSHSSFNEVHSLSVFYLITILKKPFKAKEYTERKIPSALAQRKSMFPLKTDLKQEHLATCTAGCSHGCLQKFVVFKESQKG